MSVRAISRKSGRVMWEVRWRDSGRNRSRVFDRKRDAENFDLEVRRRAQIGELDLVQAGRETPAEFAQEWWGHHAVTLEEKTQLVYADLWDRHVLPRIGQLPLRRITPELVEKYMSELRAAGVPDPTIRKTLALIQTVLQRAVVWRRISSNPVAAVKKPSQSRRVAISPPSPARVEAMRADLLARSRIAPPPSSASSPTPAYAPGRRSRCVGATSGSAPSSSSAPSPSDGSKRPRRVASVPFESSRHSRRTSRACAASLATRSRSSSCSHEGTARR